MKLGEFVLLVKIVKKKISMWSNLHFLLNVDVTVSSCLCSSSRFLLISGSTPLMKWWRASGSTSTWCWALSCCTSSRGRSTPRSWASTWTRPCRRCTARRTCCACLVGKLESSRRNTGLHALSRMAFHSSSSSPPVRIGAMLAYTPLDEKSLALLLSYLQDFLKWVFCARTWISHCRVPSPFAWVQPRQAWGLKFVWDERLRHWFSSCNLVSVWFSSVTVCCLSEWKKNLSFFVGFEACVRLKKSFKIKKWKWFMF